MENQPNFAFYIDIFSHCNLRCPSCPVGNWTGDSTIARGLMSDDLLRRIIDKAKSECNILGIGLFNWTEPLLHPRVNDLIRLVRSYGVDCAISSNLNVLRDADGFVEADPTWVRVSVSGFTQEIYERGHRHGHIDRVKENMRVLAEARDRGISKGLKPPVYECYYHKYIDNECDELLMKEYAESLGYRFSTGWAFLMPLEKILALSDLGSATATLSEEDHKLIGRLALPLKAIFNKPDRQKITSCSLLDDYITLDVNGDAWLCCGCSGEQTNNLGNFLGMPLSELQARRQAHPLCSPCMAKGISITAQERDPDYAWYTDVAERTRAAYREEAPAA